MLVAAKRIRTIVMALAVVVFVSCGLMASQALAAGDGTKIPSNRITSARTVQEAFDLYDNSVQSYSTSSMFSSEPVLQAGSYRPGALSQDAIDKTLYQLNYYRELVGLNNNIVSYDARMDYGQYGATGQEIVGSLTHAFTEDQKTTLRQYMSEEQLNKAIAGIGAGNSDPTYRLWNANCSSSNNVVTAVKGYIDDTNNVSAGVGHRLNMLDINAQAVVFGAGKSRYSCMSLYGDPFQASNPNTESLYAWPSEGFFPKQALHDSAQWSMTVSKNYSFANTSNPASAVAVKLSYKGVEYDATVVEARMYYNRAYPTVTFSLPSELKAALASSSDAYKYAGVAEVTVKVTGFVDASSNPVYAEYTTKLFKQVPVPLVSIALDENDVSLEAGATKRLAVSYNPANTTDPTDVVWSSDNESVVTVADGVVTGVKPGSATITANVNGKTARCAFTVTARMADVSVSDIENYVYDGQAKEPVPSVSFGSTELVENRDYTVSYSSNTNAGTAKVLLTGDGTFYLGTKEVEFTIERAPIDSMDAVLSQSTFTYNADVQKPQVTVGTLAQGTDYQIVWPANCTDVGNKSLRIEAKGNYTGSIAASYEIVAAPIAGADVAVDAAQTYTGRALEPVPVVTLAGRTLDASTDYSVAYASNTNAGTATVTVTGRGNYTGTAAGTFEIAPMALESGMFAAIESVTYKGAAWEPTVTVNAAGISLVEGTDYSVAYAGNTNAGTATVTITGQGNCDGTVQLPFEIEKALLVVTYAGEQIDIADAPELKLAYSGFVGSDDESALDTAPVVVAPATSAVGTYLLEPEGGAAANYEFTYVAGTLVVADKAADVLAELEELASSELTADSASRIEAAQAHLAELTATQQARLEQLQADSAVLAGKDLTTLLDEASAQVAQLVKEQEAAAEAAARGDAVSAANKSLAVAAQAQKGVLNATKASAVFYNKKWTTAAETNKLNAAVASLKACIANTSTTSAQVNAAKQKLDSALAAYKKALKKGTKNTGAIKTSSKTLKWSKLKKKAQKFSLAKKSVAEKAKVTWKKVKGSSKVKVNAKTGKVTVAKKGIKKGKTVKVTVSMTMAKTKSCTKTVVKKVIKIKVK